MKNTIIILLAGLLLISATAVTTTQIVQPKQPIDVKFLRIDNLHFETSTSILNTYMKSGYVVKNISCNSYYSFILIEKY